MLFMRYISVLCVQTERFSRIFSIATSWRSKKMLWRNLLPLLSFLVFSCKGSETPTQIYNRLMVNYSRHEAPGFPDKPTEVKLGVHVVDLKYLGGETSDFFISFDLNRLWNDPRLSFSTADGKPKTIRLPEDSWKAIWIPDTFLKGIRNVKVADDVSSNSYVTVTSDGDVFSTMIVSGVASTQSNARKHPFGKQRIEIIFESYGDTTDVLYYNTIEKHEPSDRVKQKFSISDFQLNDCTKTFSDGTFTCLKMTLAIDRGSSHFILRFYLPSTLIVILSWLAFWIDLNKSSPSRLLIGIPSLIALILLDAFAGTSKLGTNSRNSLNCWITACYIFVFGALVEFAVVNILSKKRSSARGFEYLKPPFAGSEKTVEASGKEVDDGDGDGNRKARLVDWFSRVLFPVAFLLFNLIYWIKAIA